LETLSIVFSREKTKAAVILVIFAILAYSPIIFLDQSYHQLSVIPISEADGKNVLFPTTSDLYGIFQATKPELKFAIDSISHGEFPFWNPYVGVGQPLAADTTQNLFSPIAPSYFLPVEFWDVVILLTIWLAGFFTFLFLRSLGLKFESAIMGSIIYMFSGAFSWYAHSPHLSVILFTPLILFSIEKIIQNKNPKFIVLGAVSLACGILGEHLETIILQLMLIISYFIFRVLSIYRNSRINSDQLTVTVSNYNLKRIISWSLVAFICAIGLTAFFILPAYDFMQNNHLEHDCAVLTSIDLACEPIGPNYYDPIILSSNFIPYILGQLHAYWLVVTPGFVGFWGYVGTLGLFFSILGLLTISKKDNPHRFIPLFFIGISVFFILKTVGTPLINSIGYLPILNLVSFTGYLGAIIPIGFAVAASFGVEYIGKFNVKKITIFKVFLITITILFLLLIPIIPYLSDDADFPSHVNPSDARNYFVLQVLQSIIFVVLAFITYTFSAGKNFTKTALISLVFLELSLYIPLGLHPIWIAYKAAIIIAAMVSITILSTSKRIQIVEVNQKNIKLIILILIFIFTFIGVVLISYLSPYGMMERTDPYQDNPVTDFLKENLGDSRMFSFDYALGPDFPSAYKISSLGIFGAFNINSWYDFNHNFLDRNSASPGRLGFAPWTYTYGPMGSIDTYFENKKYFDFLGVKYIITDGYDFNSIVYGTPGSSGQFVKLGTSTITQSFVSPIENISGIGISMGGETADKDKVILKLDSIPYDKKFHRESSIDKITDQQLNEFVFEQIIENVKGEKFVLTIESEQKNNDGLIVIFTHNKSEPYVLSPSEFEQTHMNFSINGITIPEKNTVFSLNNENEEIPIIFRHNNLRIHESDSSFPRTFFVNDFEIVGKNSAQEFLLQNKEFDLRNKIVLEEQVSGTILDIINKNNNDGFGLAEIRSHSANKIIIDTSNSKSEFLVLTDAFYPNWVATIDEEKAKIYLADGLVRAIFVPEGNHTIEFQYEPVFFQSGGIISFVTGIFLIVVLVYSHKFKKIS